jgi:hypothetical protein
MTQLTTTPEGFRTAAYLAARARLDAARSRSRSGKTSRRVSCNPPNVRCGGRCIPPAWDCRLKGEGPDPQLRAVKTDPLSGFANIQRGVQRITKGVTRGNLSEVQGGRAAIIRGVVKTVPGDIQQKKQLKTTLENRTRAIGIGLAVVTTGLGMHAILMKSNLYGYNKGWGKDINQATRGWCFPCPRQHPGARCPAPRHPGRRWRQPRCGRCACVCPGNEHQRHPRHHSAERHRP